jgi:uroporphyrinogen-III synthase
MEKLRGLGVLVTRPEQQAEPLCRLLRDEGARAWKFPGLAIVEDPAGQRAIAQLANQSAPDLLVFVSANAVRFARSLLRSWPAVATAAIGPATAQALHQLGHPPRIVPTAGFDTDSLLADSRLLRLNGQRVILLKGSGGRERLAAQFRKRGADLLELALYQRIPPTPTPKALDELAHLFAAEALQAVTITSLDLAEHLLAALTADLREKFATLCWLVPSQRVAAGLRDRQSRAELLIADSAEDHDLVAALAGWWTSRERGQHH